MIYTDRLHPDGKFAPLHDIHFYRKYDIIGLLRQYEKDHPDKRGIHEKVVKAVATIKNDPAYIIATTNP